MIIYPSGYIRLRVLIMVSTKNSYYLDFSLDELSELESLLFNHNDNKIMVHELIDNLSDMDNHDEKLKSLVNGLYLRSWQLHAMHDLFPYDSNYKFFYDMYVNDINYIHYYLTH